MGGLTGSGSWGHVQRAPTSGEMAVGGKTPAVPTEIIGMQKAQMPALRAWWRGWERNGSGVKTHVVWAGCVRGGAGIEEGAGDRRWGGTASRPRASGRKGRGSRPQTEMPSCGTGSAVQKLDRPGVWGSRR
jgi:hypothetical protein